MSLGFRKSLRLTLDLAKLCSGNDLHMRGRATITSWHTARTQNCVNRAVTIASGPSQISQRRSTLKSPYSGCNGNEVRAANLGAFFSAE
jgi:hypothetical protein